MKRKGQYIEFDTFGEAISEIGFKEAAALMGRKGGKAKSAAKAEAARENGKKGGRPKVLIPSPSARG